MTTPWPRRIAPAAGPRARLVAVCVLAMFAACATVVSADPFSPVAARAHVRTLAETIGSRPIGTPANTAARAYLVAALRQAGFDVRVQAADARRSELGRTAHVVNIIARRDGRRPGSIALVSHYDSAPNAPGAADAALGVAVCLEAARALATPPLDHGLTVLLTDGEEAGLMGAAALLDDPAIADIETYLNFEAIGSRGPSLLFEAGPGNGWLLDAWARAPTPRGSSLAREVYARLPNDTDFSILKRTGVPGLNFASIHDSYAYHSPLDTAGRLADATIDQTGRNAVAIVRALDEMDLTRRTTAESVYFDVLGLLAVSYTVPTQGWISLGAIVLGLAGAGRSLLAAWRSAGGMQLLLTAAWALVGTAAAIAGALAPTMVLRFASAWNHPWYGHPERLFVLIGIASVATVWLLTRLVGVLPRHARGVATPDVIWGLTLLTWAAITGLAQRAAPTATYLFSIPTLVAGLALCVAPLRHRPLGLASLVVLASVVGLWLSPLVDLSSFVTPVLGRLPVVTSTLIHPALMLAGGAMAVPPVLAIVHAFGLDGVAARRRLVPAAVTIAVGAAGLWVVVAPAYTDERPQRRVARYVVAVDSATAFWEIAGIEPFTDPDLAAGDFDWRPVRREAAAASLAPALRRPYVLRAETSPLDVTPPASVAASLDREVDEFLLHVDVRPSRPGLTLALHLPFEAEPVESSIPGVRLGPDGWVATFIAPPLEGIRISTRFRPDQEDAMRRGLVTVRVPGLPDGLGWQRLPSWLPTARVSWDTHTLSTWSVASALESTRMDPNRGATNVR